MTTDSKFELKHGARLMGIKRCPHCGIANPLLNGIWMTPQPLMPAGETSYGRMWAVYQCTSCGHAVLAKGFHQDHSPIGPVEAIFPNVPTTKPELPERARRYLEQALETLHSPDAAAVMAGSAVDAMLKDKGYAEGTLYSRISTAVADHLLTEDMGKWAHEVRLGSNRPRHADEDDPHVTPEDARQSVEFASALGEFLFVLPSRVTRGLEQAKSTDSPID